MCGSDFYSNLKNSCSYRRLTSEGKNVACILTLLVVFFIRFLLNHYIRRTILSLNKKCAYNSPLHWYLRHINHYYILLFISSE